MEQTYKVTSPSWERQEEDKVKQFRILISGFSFSYGYQAGKSLRFPDRHLSQHLTVDFNAGLFQAIQKPGVGKALSPAGGTNPGNPQPPHITLSLTAVTISITQRLKHRLMSSTVKGMLGCPVSLG
jgi:hypothetical protein